MIKRLVEKNITEALQKHVVVRLLGARRTGKTVLMQKIKTALKNKKILYLTSEDLDTAEILSSRRLSVLRNFVQGFDMLFIDEAQEIPDIGKSLKLIIDNIPEISIFITGSSSMGIMDKTGEPLTGRTLTFHLFPFSVKETFENYFDFYQNIENVLIYGSYPQVYLAENIFDKKQQLNEIKNGYLLKDVLKFDNKKNSNFVFNLLRLLAFQIGKDVSLSELAKNLSVDKKTVARYIEILEQSFVIFSLQGFSRNLRKEISKTKRYYFWDNGIRNILINNFLPLEARVDKGELWENFVISEIIKSRHYNGIFSNFYFWRTYDKKEIDLIEERDGKLHAYEIKFAKDKAKTPKEFISTYSNSEFYIINKENFWDFI